MHRYGNRSGDAGVTGYEIGAHSITIQFRDGARYLYTDRSTGPHNIARMKMLAKAGRGLTTFINQHVRGSYASRLR